MENLETLYDGDIPNGVYRYAGRASTAEILKMGARDALFPAQLNGSAIDNKTKFISATGRALRFPDYSATNWDAFEESLRDLSWLPGTGCLIVYGDPYYFAQAAPKDWATALTILTDTAAYWQERQQPFYVMLRRTLGSASAVPLLR
jgi:hypothetical protein